MNIGRFQGRPIVLFPDGWNKGWLAPGKRFAPMSAAEWREWRESYYTGIMVGPFGHENNSDPMTAYAPWGMSVHGVPKLHPQDQ